MQGQVRWSLLLCASVPREAPALAHSDFGVPGRIPLRYALGYLLLSLEGDRPK